MRKKEWFVAFTLLCVVLFAVVASADVLPKTTTATRDIVLMEDEEAGGGEQGASESNQPTADKLNVEEMHHEDFRLSLTSGNAADGDVYAIGDKLTLFFSADQDCHLTILDFTPSGKILVLFPNKWVSDNMVKAGETVSIPAQGQKFSMKVGGPAGVDVIKAIATNKEVPILDPANQTLMGPFAVLEDPKAATRDILLVEEEEENASTSEQPLKWAAASLAVFTKGQDPAEGGFGVAKNGDWIAKIWADRDAFLTGEAVFVKLQSTRPATLVSLVNKGASGKENSLLPEGVTREVKPGAITVLPGRDDKWKLIAASDPGKDVITATIRDEKGEELSVSFTVSVEE